MMALQINGDAEFWHARSELTYIHDYARACQVSPWALLSVVLARVCAAVPPHVATQPLYGDAPGTLNLFVAVLGGSGDGKGLTERMARTLLPDIRNATTALPVSGEGIPAVFATRETQEEDGRRTVISCINPRALLSVPEITALGGSAKRLGSTLIPTLTSAYSGEALGGFNKNEANRLMVPEYGYRIALVTGVQPHNLNVIMDEEGTGLPQRFLWADTADYDAPEKVPPMPIGRLGFDVSALPEDMPDSGLDALYEAGDRWRMIDHGEANYPLTILRYPRSAFTAAEKDGWERLHRARQNPLDAHRIGLTIKIAGLLALLSRPDSLTVTEEDWALAVYVYRRSAEFRDEAIRQFEAIKRNLKARAYALDSEARDEADARRLNRIKTGTLKWLDEHDPGHEGVVGHEISRARGRDSKHGMVYMALESLYAEGKVDKVGGGPTPQSTLWAVSAC